MILVIIRGTTPAVYRNVDAGYPNEVTFNRLDVEGGTEYSVAVYTINGPKESDPVILDVCTCKLNTTMLFVSVLNIT